MKIAMTFLADTEERPSLTMKWTKDMAAGFFFKLD